MFGFFKKKKEEEPHYDPTNIRITDLRKGWFLDYNFDTWQVVEEYEYDWGKGNFSYEFLIRNGEGEKLFLSIDTEDGLRCTLFRKIKFAQLPEADTIAEKIQQTNHAPRRTMAEGHTFYLESESPGYFRNIDKEAFQELIVWEYYDDTELKMLNIEQWGDNSFEAAIGDVIPEIEFSNLTPVNRES